MLLLVYQRVRHYATYWRIPWCKIRSHFHPAWPCSSAGAFPILSPAPHFPKHFPPEGTWKSQRKLSKLGLWLFVISIWDVFVIGIPKIDSCGYGNEQVAVGLWVAHWMCWSCWAKIGTGCFSEVLDVLCNLFPVFPSSVFDCRSHPQFQYPIGLPVYVHISSRCSGLNHRFW